MNSEQLVTLRGEDGTELVCRVLCVFEFEDREYGLLLTSGEAGAPPEEEPEPVLMKVRAIDGQAEFQVIEDDDEFARVTVYAKELIADLEDDGTQDGEFFTST